jgi:hypothetical protein
MTRGIIVVAPTASVAEVNQTLEDMGRGPNSLSRALTTDPLSPTPTHYLMSDQSGDADIEAAMTLALAPINGAMLDAFDTTISPAEQVATVLTDHGLYFIPDPE